MESATSRFMLVVAALAVFTLLTVAPAPAADTAPATAPAKNPGPIIASLILNKDTYTLDPAQSGQAFRDKLAEAKKGLKQAPPTAKVDITLRLANISDKPFTLHIGGDESRIALKLAGEGAVSMPNMIAMTMEFRSGTPVTIAPGKTYDMAITSLSYGARGVSECAYWTEPGDYTLSAVLTATKDEGQVVYITDPVKIKITKN